MNALVFTGDGDLSLLPRLHSLHLYLPPIDPTPQSLSWALCNTVDIITRRGNAENLPSIKKVVVCGTSWGRLLPHSLKMDKLVPNITYKDDGVRFQKVRPCLARLTFTPQ